MVKRSPALGSKAPEFDSSGIGLYPLEFTGRGRLSPPEPPCREERNLKPNLELAL
jgi:hypothetical protein